MSNIPKPIINHIMEYAGCDSESFNVQLCEEYLQYNDIHFNCIDDDLLTPCENNFISNLYEETYCDCGSTLMMFIPQYEIIDWYDVLLTRNWRKYGHFAIINCNMMDEPDWR